jgi:AraC-like DNA-binding protein
MRSERLAFARSSLVPGVEIMSAWDSFRLWHVFHERFALCACRTAAAGWRYRGQDHFMNDGSVALMEPGEVHRNTLVQKYSDFKVLFIEPDVLLQAADDLGAVSGSRPHLRVAQTEDPSLHAAIYRLSDSIDARGPALEVQVRLAECLTLLTEYTENAPRRAIPDRRAVELAKSILRQRFNEDVTLAELAGALRASPYHLARAFKATVGLSPHAFQVHVRIERAMKLMRQGMPAVDAASQVGFADQSHFTRHFKRVIGLTPGRYARSAR